MTRWYTSTVLALVSVAVVVALVASSDTASPPEVPKQFSTYCINSITGFSQGNGSFYYDAKSERMRFDANRIEPVSGMWLNRTFWYSKNNSWLSTAGLCKTTGYEFADMFDWVKYATYTGNTTINGEECALWYLPAKTANLTLCTVGNRPVLYEVLLPTFPQTVTYLFSGSFDVGPPPQQKLIPPDSCNKLPEPCPHGKSEETHMYIFHPKNTTGDIVDQDLADLLGDTVFICADAVSNHTEFDKYAWVSQYKIEVMTSWGLYQECNGYPPTCTGATDGNVGHESAMGVGEGQGRCSKNEDLGNWYSLPKKGKCDDNHKPGDDSGCTWKILQRVKTIDGHCLLHTQGMLDMCKQEVKLPLTKSKKILKDAMELDDVSKGGCPSVA